MARGNTSEQNKSQKDLIYVYVTGLVLSLGFEFSIPSFPDIGSLNLLNRAAWTEVGALAFLLLHPSPPASRTDPFALLVEAPLFLNHLLVTAFAGHSV